MAREKEINAQSIKVIYTEPAFQKIPLKVQSLVEGVVQEVELANNVKSAARRAEQASDKGAQLNAGVIKSLNELILFMSKTNAEVQKNIVKILRSVLTHLETTVNKTYQHQDEIKQALRQGVQNAEKQAAHQSKKSAPGR
ncbi:MAG: hypothetical protein ACD_60C00128G0022 [uncultured bacterium]|nr:MAG: hypothetical protein ACD_60C00128G0022 [uncultured bacterium]